MLSGYDYDSFVSLDITIDAAEETFKDSARPLPGIVIKSSERLFIISDGPIDSLENVIRVFLFVL